MTIETTYPLRRRDLGRALIALSAWASGLGSSALAHNRLPSEVRIGFQKGSAILVLFKKQLAIEALV